MTNIFIEGTVVSEPTYSHESHGEKFYEVCVASLRKSDYSDTITVVVPELLAEGFRVLEEVAFIGEVRTRNEDGHLKIYAFAKELCEVSGLHDNKVTITGFICKEPTYRETPLGRQISDVVLASNRPFGSDYIPCILWGRNAKKVSVYPVGTELEISGRLQSRRYQKRIGDALLDMTAYEVSVSEVQKI